MPDDLRLTDTQRSILEALCRPCAGEGRFAPPATNQEIADELFLSVDAIKAHLRVLFRKFGIEDLPHNQKRARLAELAFERGIVSSDGGLAEQPPRAEEAEGPDAVAVPAERVPEAPGPRRPGEAVPKQRRPGLLLGAGAALGLVLIAVIAVLLLGGGDGSSEPAPSKPEYVATVQGICRDAVRNDDASAQRTRRARALEFQKSILFVITSLESQPRPSGDQPRLDQFQAGLASAANRNGQVSVAPVTVSADDLAPTAADLIIAAGNVQAGALGFGLGPPCTAIGGLVEESAENAAGPA